MLIDFLIINSSNIIMSNFVDLIQLSIVIWCAVIIFVYKNTKMQKSYCLLTKKYKNKCMEYKKLKDIVVQLIKNERNYAIKRDPTKEIAEIRKLKRRIRNMSIVHIDMLKNLI